MSRISVAEIEARSGVEKRSGETLAEYLRRVGERTDLSDGDVEAVITELQRQRFAGESHPDESDAPVEAFLAAAGSLGASEPAADAAEGTAEAPSNETTAAATEPEGAGADDAEPTNETDGEDDDDDDGEDGDENENPLSFYRSVAVVAVVILLGVGVLGSAVLLGTDLGSIGDDPEEPAETPALEDADADGADASGDDGSDVGDGDGAPGDGTDADGVDDGGGDDADAGDADMDETDADDTDADGADEDDVDEDDAGGDDVGVGGSDDESEDEGPIGFGEGDDADDADDEETDSTGVAETDDAETGDAEGADEESADADALESESEGDETEPEETEPEDAEPEETEPDVIGGAPEATGSLEVTDRAAPGGHPADEYVELTNVGDAPLEMSEWTVRDREGGVVDTHGVEPLVIPDGFVLEPGASVRLVTGTGENTADTLYWGHERQHWRDAGDVVIVQDAEGGEVLRHPYGDQA